MLDKIKTPEEAQQALERLPEPIRGMLLHKLRDMVVHQAMNGQLKLAELGDGGCQLQGLGKVPSEADGPDDPRVWKDGECFVRVVLVRFDPKMAAQVPLQEIHDCMMAATNAVAELIKSNMDSGRLYEKRNGEPVL